MGAATSSMLEAEGQRVIGVDLRGATITADVGDAAGRAHALDAIRTLSDGVVDGVVTWAGVAGLTERPGSVVVSVNFFGTIALLEGLRPLLAAGDRPAAVAISSNSTTAQPGIPTELVERCLAGDEEAARDAADEAGGLLAYPASKLAVARWVRHHAPTEQWAGAGITLNALVPGAVETPMLTETRRDPTIGRFIDEFPIPVGRKGRPEELAAFTCFLLGPDARFICGSVLFVDGGTDALLRPDTVPSPM